MESYSFKILHEKVSDIDAFEGKTHEKAANNLYTVIESSQPAVTIGLEGGWGSGKSTVVNLLKHKLSQDEKNTLIYLFDAWAHDGDPLRRIFLEGLIDEIDPEAEDETIQKVRNEISGRKKTVEVKTKKSTSKLGGFLSLSAIFVPLGAAVLSAIDYSTVYWLSTDMKIHWPFLAGLALTLMPLWTLISWGFTSKNDPKKEGRRLFARKRWDIFESETEESYTQDITEDGERTSIEFERFFVQIMDLSLGDDKKYHRALIVIDNLDRVEPEQTLSIWSILQTFFQYRSHGNTETNPWQNKLWFLIPYDREGLSKVWDKTSQPEKREPSTTEGFPEFGVHTDKNLDKGIADSFLEKCFQLVEEVPEAVLTSWVEYCEMQVHESLNGWPKSSREAVIDTFKRYESSLSKSPTPRQIQSFANKVGMLGLRWGASVSPEAIALYALLRRNRSDRQLRAELIKPGIPDTYQASDSPQLKAELAGLLFGVDESKGIQLLLEPEISKALRDGDPTKISNLISDHGEAFWVVWHSIRQNTLPRGHVEEHRIATTKAFCQGIQGHIHRVKPDIDHLIGEWKSRESKWELDKHHYTEALSALISVSTDQKENFVTWLHEKVKAELKLIISQIDKDKLKQSALKEIRSLMDYLKSIKKPIKNYRYEILNQKNWITWIDILSNESLNFPEVFPNKKAVLDMAETIDAVNAGGDIINKITETLKIDDQETYHQTISTKLIAWLTTPNRTVGLNKPYELLAKCYLKVNKSYQDKIKAALLSPNFVRRSQQEPPEIIPVLTALFSITEEGELAGNNLPANIVSFLQRQPTPDEVENFINILEDNNSLNVAWIIARENTNKLASHLIRQFEDSRIYSVCTGAFYIDEYEWATEEEMKFIVNNLISCNAFEDAKNEFINDPITYSGCLEKLSKHGGEYGKNFISEILSKITSENWGKSFEKDSKLLLLLTKKGNHEFKDGVQLFATEDISKKELTSTFWDMFFAIYNKLPDKDEVLEKILKRYFAKDSDPFDEKAFSEISKCISTETLSKINPAHIMQRLEAWISGDQWERIEWILGYKFPVAITPSESLSSRLSAYRSKGNEGHFETIDMLASIYKIETSKLKSDNKENQPVE